MNRLLLIALLMGSVAPLSTGCVFVGGDDDDNGTDPDPDPDPLPDPEGQLDVAWDPYSAFGAADGCPVGDETIEVISLDAGGTEIKDLFDCVDGSGITDPLALGQYTVWVNLLDPQGNLLAQSFSEDVTIASDGQTVQVPTFEFPYDAGYFGLTWSLTDDTQALSCAEVGANNVRLFITSVSVNGSDYDDVFDCADMSGTSGAVELDTYDVAAQLFDADMQPLSDPSLTRTESITFGNELVDLGNIEFVFPPI